MWHVTYCWKALEKGYNFALGLHTSKVPRIPILGISGLPTWEFSNLGVLRQNDIWMQPSCLITNNTIRGKVVASPSSGHDESCESVYARGLFMHKKCPNYALTNLFFCLCKFMWIIDLLVTCPSPRPGAPTHLLPPKCCELKSVPQLFFFPCFHF